MTEEQWLRAADVFTLAHHLCSVRHLNRTKAGRRKFWLFACACCRRHWTLFEADPASAAIVVTAERFADGEVAFAEVRNSDKRLTIPNHGRAQNVMLATRSLVYTNALIVATSAAQHCASAISRDLSSPSEVTQIWSDEQAQQCRLFRDIFGNPFRPVAFDPAWRTSDVVLLARGIYEERAFGRMLILADALQDAGCTNEDILSHCRDANQPHARGCWVVDLVLGKS